MEVGTMQGRVENQESDCHDECLNFVYPDDRLRWNQLVEI